MVRVAIRMTVPVTVRMVRPNSVVLGNISRNAPVNRTKDVGVRRLVPYPYPAGPSVAEIHLANGCAIGKDAVVSAQVVLPHRFGCGNRTVMRIVEEEAVVAALFAVAANSRHEQWVV